MAETEHHKKARDLMDRTGYAGSHLHKPSAFSEKMEKAEIRKDVTKGVHDHESHDHPGTRKTDIKFKDGGFIPGRSPHHRADKKPRGGDIHIQVNPPAARPVPVPVPMNAGPMPPRPPMPPPGPPPGTMAGGPPGAPPMGPPGMPMRKGGGRTYADGGSVKDSPTPSTAERVTPRPLSAVSPVTARPATTVTPAPLNKNVTAYRGGGRVPGIDGGAGGGMGRKQKSEALPYAKDKGGRGRA